MQNDNQWLHAKLSTIEPAWTPNAPLARHVLNARLDQPKERRPWLPLAGAVAAALTLFAIFNGRAVPKSSGSTFF